ncbi:MAG: hypothetical protein HOQ24_11375 [Mycobacteriaceae bacterium]|nr:hypothetical protein [Mycobacteriaceae bacterium]
MLVCAAVMLAGAVLALLTVRDRPVRECPEAARPEARTHCALAAPPLETRTAD